MRIQRAVAEPKPKRTPREESSGRAGAAVRTKPPRQRRQPQSTAATCEVLSETEWGACRDLTVKLRGRTQAPDQSRGCTLSSCTRGDTTDCHGPLQRLLDR